MAISEKKMQIVIDNYFKSECDVNTSIRQAFEKGFRIGVMKGQCSQENQGDLISRRAILDRTVNRNSIWNKITDSEGNNLEDILNSTPSVENKCFDGMTNGEVLQALFPNIELGEKVYNTRRYFLMGESIETFDFKTIDKWWDAPYQKGGE